MVYDYTDKEDIERSIMKKGLVKSYYSCLCNGSARRSYDLEMEKKKLLKKVTFFTWGAICVLTLMVDNLKRRDCIVILIIGNA